MVGVETCNGCRLLNSPWLCREEVCEEHRSNSCVEDLKAENRRFKEALEQIRDRWDKLGSLAAKHMEEIANKELEAQDEVVDD